MFDDGLRIGMTKEEKFDLEGEFEKAFEDELMALPDDEFDERCRTILRNSRDYVDWVQADRDVRESFKAICWYIRMLNREECRMNAISAVMAARKFGKAKLVSA